MGMTNPYGRYLGFLDRILLYNILIKIKMPSIYLILPAALGPGVYSGCNRNEYQKQKNISGK
jgi:hypothetical protein